MVINLIRTVHILDCHSTLSATPNDFFFGFMARAKFLKIFINEVADMYNCCERYRIDVDGFLATSAICKETNALAICKEIDTKQSPSSATLANYNFSC